jgi:hypothetical protein
VTLTRAIDAYEAGRLEEASRLLVTIPPSAGSTAAAADFFRGMIALAHREPSAAEEAFLRARRDPSLEASSDLMRHALRRQGSVAALLLVQPGYDSNVALLPDTPPSASTLGPPQGDADVLFLGTLDWRPLQGLWLKETAFCRKEIELHQFDLFSEQARVGYELARAQHRVSGAYTFDLELLGGASYLMSHRGTFAYRLVPSSSTSFSVAYDLRRRDFDTAQTTGFTGWVHAATLGGAHLFGHQLLLQAGLLGQREITADASFTNWAGGGHASLQYPIARQLRVSGVGEFVVSNYDNLDATGARRRDERASGGVEVVLNLGWYTSLLAGVDVTKNFSTIEDFRYFKAVAHGGLAIYWGRP